MSNARVVVEYKLLTLFTHNLHNDRCNRSFEFINREQVGEYVYGLTINIDININ